jgi:hypothetical protein
VTAAPRGAPSASSSRTCSAEGGSATSISPVIRGSITIHNGAAPGAATSSTTRLPRRKTPAIVRPASRSMSTAGRGAVVIGRTRPRGNVAATIRRPTQPAIPRHIVSTSGSSGMRRRAVKSGRRKKAATRRSDGSSPEPGYNRGGLPDRPPPRPAA